MALRRRGDCITWYRSDIPCWLPGTIPASWNRFLCRRGTRSRVTFFIPFKGSMQRNVPGSATDRTTQQNECNKILHDKRGYIAVQNLSSLFYRTKLSNFVWQNPLVSVPSGELRLLFGKGNIYYYTWPGGPSGDGTLHCETKDSFPWWR